MTSQSMTAASPASLTTERPLAGTVVLDLTQIYNGPYATFMLAAAGAEVIKIEPHGGEHLRRRTIADTSTSKLPFAMLNAGKRSLRLDLKTDAGRDIVLRLAEQADVLVENFAPGVLTRLGLGPEVVRARNPRIVYASSTGYGDTGPYRDYLAMDLSVQAMSGVMSVTGYPDQPPLKSGPAVCDFFAGVHLYGAIVTALLERTRTGRGRSVQVTMMEATYFSLTSNLGMVHAQPGLKYARTGNRQGGMSISPYNVYEAKDGHIAIVVNHDKHWQSLLTAFGQEALAQDPRYLTNVARVSRMDEVDDLITSWTRQLPKQEIFERLNAHHVPGAPVRELSEVMEDTQLHSRGALRWIDHPEYGRIAAPASPLRFDGEAMLPERPSVPLGTDSHAVLQERLGMTSAEIAALEKSGVI